jgi:hypothetical protein
MKNRLEWLSLCVAILVTSFMFFGSATSRLYLFSFWAFAFFAIVRICSKGWLPAILFACYVMLLAAYASNASA